MLSTFISYQHSQIHYRQLGAGENLLLCFHGFGETADSFIPLAHQLVNKYTIIVIELPWHGRTVWNEGMTFTIEDLVAIIDSIPVMHKRRFSVMGYSMGGRVALHLYQLIPQRIQQLILLAPDGLKINFWYWLATQTAAGNRLFHYFMKNPAMFFTITNALKNKGMINLGVYNYVQQYLNQQDKRKQLYTIWTTMRKIKPVIPSIQLLINKHKTPVLLVYGKYDRIIRHSTGSNFKKGINEFCTLHILNCGHSLLHEKYTAAIATLL